MQTTKVIRCRLQESLKYELECVSSVFFRNSLPFDLHRMAGILQSWREAQTLTHRVFIALHVPTPLFILIFLFIDRMTKLVIHGCSATFVVVWWKLISILRRIQTAT